MEDKNPIQKEISNKNLNNRQKQHIVQQKKAIQNKVSVNEQKQNNDEKRQEKNEIIDSDDELDHPSPLLSDYYEEDKEEIKLDFFQNKLKEKNKKKSSNNLISKKENMKLEIKNKKQVENNDFPSKSLSKKIKKINIKINLCNNSASDNKKKEINEKKILPQKQLNYNKENTLISKKLEENDINKENINDNNRTQIDIEVKNKKIEKISHQKTNKINNIIKIEKSNNIVKQEEEEEIKKFKKINKIPKRKKLNSKKKPLKIIKKSLNIENTSIPINKNKIEAKNLSKIYSIVNNKAKNFNIISKDSVGDSFSTINSNNMQSNIGNLPHNKSQLFSNNSTIINNENNYKSNLGKKKMASNKPSKKSNSYSSIPLNKIYYENSSKLKKSKNSIHLENSISLENLAKTEHKARNPKSRLDLEQKNLFNSKENINKTFEKYTNINKIPLPLNEPKYLNNNKIMNRDIQNINNPKNCFDNMLNNNYSSSNIYNNVKINNIHNNNFFYNKNVNIEQKENVQNNSQYQNKGYKISGNFNNVQTTFVVASKNSSSKIKLIPKKIKTIDYETVKFLNSNQSDIFLKSKICQQEPNNHYLSIENNSIQNKNYSCYSNYGENKNNVQNNPMGKIRMHKSQLNLHIKNNFCNCGDQHFGNNYGMNYNECMRSSINANENQTIITQNRSNYYFINRPLNDQYSTMEYYDYNNNYEKNYAITEPSQSTLELNN